ncbi:MAG: hypothetical protein JW891_15695 [Candidatus Lokiarchaeota archaeon]|nr:hypothetical protein [Candidatus Lokiarchaeota archaeon]
MTFNTVTEVSRSFQYDYIFFDAIFLAIWLAVLVKFKKWKAIKAGIITGIIVYFIDAVWWWNAPWNDTFIREYWIGGVAIPRQLGSYFFLKFGADFMMCMSYSLYAFAWLWIAFENIEKKNKNELLLFTFLYFAFWMIVPLLSTIVPLYDVSVYTIRHMDSQIIVWIVNVFVGYLLLAIIYGTKYFGKKDLKILLYVLIIGCTESFFMEVPLFIFGIRPNNGWLLLYEIFFLFNQGAPYLYIFWDKILPFLKKKKEQFFK